MGVSRAVGYPNMEAAQLIAKLWSKIAIAKQYDNSILTSITNTDADTTGIKSTGSKVVFNRVPDVTVRASVKGGVTIWQDVEPDYVELDINKANEYAFRMDGIDIFQANIKIMDALAVDAGKKMDLFIVKELLNSVYVDAASQNKGNTAGVDANIVLGATGAPFQLTKSTILDKLIDLIQVGEEQNWDDDDGWWIALPPVFRNMIKKSDLKDASLTGDDKSILRNRGNIGRFDKWDIFKTNQYTPISDTFPCYNILFGHKKAICYASQMIDTQYHDKFENGWGKGMKGRNVHGYKVLNSDLIGVLYCRA